MRFLGVVLSAGLVGVSFPPLDWSGAGLVAWVPLMWALRGVDFKWAVRLGVIHGFLAFGITLSWTWNIFGTMAPALWFILALLTGLFGAGVYLVRSVEGGVQGPVLAMWWTGIEYFRCEVFVLSFPWITPGTALPPSVWTSVVGVYGVSFFVIYGSVTMSQGGWRSSVGTLVAFLFVLGIKVGDVREGDVRVWSFSLWEGLEGR